MWRIRVFALLLFVTLNLIFTIPVMGAATSSFTVTARGDIGVAESPSGFTVAWITDTEVRLDWTPGYGANSTLILAKVGSLPTSPTDGYIVYSGAGSTANDTFTNLDIIGGKVYYAAFSYREPDYSEGVSGDVEGIGMTEIATSLDSLTAIMNTVGQLGFGAFLVIGLLGLALWKRDIIWYSASGLAALIIGIGWIGEYTGIAFAVIGIATFQLLEAVILGASSGRGAKGISQFKGITNTIKGWF